MYANIFYLRQAVRDYYWAHREILLPQMKLYYQQNLDQCREYGRQYYWNHLEQFTEYKKSPRYLFLRKAMNKKYANTPKGKAAIKRAKKKYMEKKRK